MPPHDVVALLSRPPEVPPRTTRGVGGEAVLRPVRTPSASRCSLGAAPLAFAVCSTIITGEKVSQNHQ